EPSVEWPIEISFRQPTRRPLFLPTFDGEWRLENDAMLYALPKGGSQWTFPDASDAPETYSKVQIGVQLAGLGITRSRESLAIALADVRAVSKPVDGVAVEPSYSLDAAAERARTLFLLCEWVGDNDDGWIRLCLLNRDGFDESEVDEILFALGFDPYEA